MITTVNPTTGRELGQYPTWDDEQIEQAVADGAAAAAARGREPLETRIAAVRRLASTVRAQQDFFAAFVTAEMGKPLAESAGEITKSAVTADYHADRAR